MEGVKGARITAEVTSVVLFNLVCVPDITSNPVAFPRAVRNQECALGVVFNPERVLCCVVN